MYVSLGQAARALGVTPATVRRWTATGFLPCVRTAGGHRRIAKEDVDDLKRALGGSSQVEARRAREREVDTLAQAAIDLASILDQKELLATIARHVTSLCDCTTCAISLYDPDARTLRTLAEYDAKGRSLPPLGVFDLADYAPTQRAIDEQRPLVINVDDRGADTNEIALMRRLGDKSVLVLPLVFQNRVIGVLEANDTVRSRRYSAQELRLCKALAGHAAVALRNAELFEAASREQEFCASVGRRLTAFAEGLTKLGDLKTSPDGMTALADLTCAVFEARSCLIARDGRLLAGAMTSSSGTSKSGGTEALVLNGSCRLGDTCFELTIATEHRVERGEAELVDVIAALVAQLA